MFTPNPPNMETHSLLEGSDASSVSFLCLLHVVTLHRQMIFGIFTVLSWLHYLSNFSCTLVRLGHLNIVNVAQFFEKSTLDSQWSHLLIEQCRKIECD